MENAIYTSLTRQSGLMREMRVIANNIANADTTGFRREGVVFSEYLKSLDSSGESLSMANARGRTVDLRQAGMSQTNAPLDMAIEGDGFFLVETPAGNRLTRAGNFLTSVDGLLVTPDGNRVLDEGQAPITIPMGAGKIAVGTDGTVTSNGIPVARIGMFQPENPHNVLHQGGTTFRFEGEVQPAETAMLRQGFVEGSNVDPVFEISRMIEVQRAYEMGQALLEREDQRIRSAITTMTR